MCDIIAVTNRALCSADFLRRLEAVAASGVSEIILREKDLSPPEYAALAGQALDICRRHNIPCTLHTYADVAKALSCRRIHLPLPVLAARQPTACDFDVIGASVHTAEEAKQAEALGATYLTAGHIFPTDCKKGLPARGLGFLRDVCGAVGIPVYAIGGILPGTIEAAAEAGARGVCLMSSLMRTEDAAGYVLNLRSRLRKPF